MKGFTLHRVVMKKIRNTVLCVQSGISGAVGESLAAPLVTKVLEKSQIRLWWLLDFSVPHDGLVPGAVLDNHLLLITEVDKEAGLVDINRICWWMVRTAVISAKYT